MCVAQFPSPVGFTPAAGILELGSGLQLFPNFLGHFLSAWLLSPACLPIAEMRKLRSREQKAQGTQASLYPSY